jgi:hypothetical protein
LGEGVKVKQESLHNLKNLGGKGGEGRRENDGFKNFIYVTQN